MTTTVSNEDNLVYATLRVYQTIYDSNAGDAMKTDHGDVLTIDELAIYLKVSKSTLYKLVQEGSLPGQKVGKHWRFRRETIDQWLDEKSKNRSGKQPRSAK